jgi:hypothetical protein
MQLSFHLLADICVGQSPLGAPNHSRPHFNCLSIELLMLWVFNLCSSLIIVLASTVLISDPELTMFNNNISARKKFRVNTKEGNGFEILPFEALDSELCRWPFLQKLGCALGYLQVSAHRTSDHSKHGSSQLRGVRYSEHRKKKAVKA